MSILTCQLSISLDGYAAGPNQSLENPIGEGGMRLHQWVLKTDTWREQHGQSGGERSPDSEVVEEVTRNVGAYIMGRNMFTPARGDWDPEWRGWWGEDPPDHTPVYVLTPRPPPPPRPPGGSRSRCRAARPSTSSPTASSPRSSRRAPPPASGTSRSPA